jgi:hypothetical protein
MAKQQNRPGGPTNPRQHSAGEERGRAQPRNKHAPTGRGSGSEAVADPHPSTEEHYDRIRHPGGAKPPNETHDVGQNTWAHDGTPQPRPRNADNE